MANIIFLQTGRPFGAHFLILPFLITVVNRNVFYILFCFPIRRLIIIAPKEQPVY